MNISDKLFLEKTEIKYHYKQLIVSFFVQLSIISVVMVLLIMSKNVVSIFDQYYHNEISDTYSITIKNIEYSDFSYLKEQQISDMYVYMPNLEISEFYYNNQIISNSTLNLICNENSLSDTELIQGNDYTETDNLNRSYFAWISSEISDIYNIQIGDVIQYKISESDNINFTVQGIKKNIGAYDIFVPFNTFSSDALIHNNIDFYLSANIDSIVNYDSLKFYLETKNKKISIDELESIFSLIFFIKSIFIGLSLIGIILCVLSLSNIYSMQIYKRTDYIKMLFQLGMNENNIKNLYFYIFYNITFFAIIFSYFIAKRYLRYFNTLLHNKLNNIFIPTDTLIYLQIVFLIFSILIIKILILKIWKNIRILPRIRG